MTSSWSSILYTEGGKHDVAATGKREDQESSTNQDDG